MKIDRYRELMNHIDTDLVCDDRIKDELRFCEFYEKDEKSIISLKEKPTFRRHPIFTALQSVSMVGRVLTSMAFLAVLLIVFISVHIHLQSTVATNSDSSTPPINQESEANNEITQNTVEETVENTVVDVTESEITDATADTTETTETSEEETDVIEGEDIYLPIDATEDLPVDTVDIPEVEEDTNATAPDNDVDTDKELADEEEEKSVEDISKPGDANKDNTTVVADNAKVGDFYFAHFDVVVTGKVKTSIPSLVIRLHGVVDSINPDDLTDIILTRDGVPIDNGIALMSKIDQFAWGNEDITDFYFKFSTNNTEPGIYGLTGKYKGVSFDVYNKIIEAEITDVAANPDDLNQVNFGGFMDDDNNWISFSEIVFFFNGLQNSFYISDLTDMKITCNGKEIPYSYQDYVHRYYEVSYDNNADTSFNLVLNDKFTEPGVYIITGNYRGMPFVSNELIIP